MSHFHAIRAYSQPSSSSSFGFGPGSAELLSISDWLSDLQSICWEFGFEEFFIGGGSARELLDHAYRGRSIKMRDIDIFLFRNEEADPVLFESFVNAIEDNGIAKRRDPRIKAKKRANPALAGSAGLGYVAGLGAHLFRDDMPILSLSLFHSEADLDINGLLNIDRIYLRLSTEEPLDRHLARLVALCPEPERLRGLGLIKDPADGYVAWINSQPKPIHWLELERAPVRHAIRVTRSFAKAGCPGLPQALIAHFSQLITSNPGDPIDDQHEFARGVLKVFGDRFWAEELTVLAQIGVLRLLSEGLQSFVSTHSAIELRSRLDEPVVSEVSGADLVVRRISRILDLSADAQSASLKAHFIDISSSVFES